MHRNLAFQDLILMGEEFIHNYQFDQGLAHVSAHLTSFTGAQRCSIFIHEKESDELWTILSTGIEKIHLSTAKGLVGYVFRTKKPIIENNVQKNTYFLNDIDKESGFTTRNIIASPIYNINKEIIGVLELLNKQGGFDEEDLRFINYFSHYLGSIIELAPFYLKNKLN